MASDDKVILTADRAISMLPDGDYVHNYANPGMGLVVGCDYDRQDAENALREAKQIELGGPQCMAMKHPIVCWHTKKRLTFFEADMDKVSAFEAERQEPTESRTFDEETGQPQRTFTIKL